MIRLWIIAGKVLFIAALCCSCLEYLYPRTEYVLVSTGQIEIYAKPGQEGSVQKCFIDNVDAYTEAMGFNLDEYAPATVSDTLPDAWAAAYFPGSIWINKKYDNQLSGYGHELVRHYCWVTNECDYQWPDTPEWTGEVGELWFKAENLSLEYCP